MILQALAALAKREGLVDDPDYEPKPVRWVINLGPGGKYLGVTETQGQADVKGKVRPLVMQVPRSAVRTSGSAAAFLVDKAEYVLGFDPDDKPTKRAKLEHHNSLFSEFVESAVALASDEGGLLAVLAFLRDAEAKARCVDELRGRAASNDLLAFAYLPDDGSEGRRVHDRDAVRSAWQRLRSPTNRDDVVLATCLICGQAATPVRVHPQVKRIPGGTTSGIALVSSNADAFLSLGLESVPVCQACAEAYGTALNRLFHPQYTDPKGRVLGRRVFRLSDDTAVVYWASEQHQFEDEFHQIDFADPAQAEALFKAVHHGVGVWLDDPTPFHALIVTGGQGRATLRGYHQTTVGEVARNLRLYFEDVDIVARYANAPKRLALRWLIRSLAAQGKDENVDPNLAGRLFLAILTGSIFPTAVLQAALGRIRSEPEDPDRRQTKHPRERMALIRAALNRRLRAKDPIVTGLIPREIPTMLDETCDNNAYCLGRLFAVLEKLQGEAIGNPGATITDRFYGAASATPVVVFGQLLRKAQHHLAKVEGHFYSKKVQEILGLLSPHKPFPPTLSLEEQGLFAVGYYHQKADLWKPRDKTETPAPEAVPAVAE
jgi:CRISPR-associated protein Csd1